MYTCNLFLCFPVSCGRKWKDSEGKATWGVQWCISFIMFREKRPKIKAFLQNQNCRMKATCYSSCTFKLQHYYWILRQVMLPLSKRKTFNLKDVSSLTLSLIGNSTTLSVVSEFLYFWSRLLTKFWTQENTSM